MLLMVGVQALAAVLAPAAKASQTLSAIKKRGHVACGVAEGAVGFSEVGRSGKWSGLDIEFCRWTNVGGRPLGLHFMWHLLNAWALYVLIVAAVRHTADEVPRSPGLRGDPVP